MSEEHDKQISEDDLHAYADGLLDASRAGKIAAWLEAHPDEAAEVAGWQAQNSAIKEMFAPAASISAGDLNMLEPKSSAVPFWRNAAAAIGLLVVGATGGYVLNDTLAPDMAPAPMLASFPQEAGDAYLTYVSEVRHAVEVNADETEHLTTWLGKRLDWEFTIPDLSGEGFDLVGGRLLPINGLPGAMLLYENESGLRVSVIIARNNGASDTAWQLARNGDVGTYYWIDGPRSYAISGRLADDDLREVTGLVYAQFGDWPEP